MSSSPVASSTTASERQPRSRSPPVAPPWPSDAMGADAQLVVVRSRCRVDHATRIATEIVPLRRRLRDGGVEVSTREHRAERVQSRTAVASHGGEIGHVEPRLRNRWTFASVQRVDAGPEHRRHGGKVRRFALELRPCRHRWSPAVQPYGAWMRSRSATMCVIGIVYSRAIL